MDQKQELKKNLKNLKNDYLVTIYKGLAKKEGTRTIHDKLLKQTINSKVQDKTMLSHAVKSLYHISKRITNKSFVEGFVKQTYGESIGGDLLAIFIFDLLMKKTKTEKHLSHDITRIADKNEGDTKHEVLVDSFKRNRKLDDPRVFYLASYHKDSASDHAKWQGKIYVDEAWESVRMDDETKEAIRQFIRKNNIKTVQWVTGKPVWFITRPNCRHYLSSLETSEAIGKSRRFLLKQKGMKTAIGDRQYLQTINHATTKNWYDDVRNAQLLLDKYEERLILHSRMYEAVPNPIIAQAIRKDRELIQKWKTFIKEKNRKRG